MNVMEAMKETVYLASSVAQKLPNSGPLSAAHLINMYHRMREREDENDPMSYGKKCRWLGWAQCAVVASGAATLEDMKRINERNKKDPDDAVHTEGCGGVSENQEGGEAVP